MQSLTRVLTQNPNSVQGRLAMAQAYAAAKDLKAAIGTLEEIIEDEPRVASALAQYQEQAGLLMDAAASYTLALAVQPSEPRAEDPPHRRAARGQGVRSRGRVCRRRAQAASEGAGVPAAAGARAVRRRRSQRRHRGARGRGEGVPEGHGRRMFALVDIYADAGRTHRCRAHAAPDARRASRPMPTR